MDTCRNRENADRSNPTGRVRAGLAVLVASLAFGVFASAASAANIEGVWSFNGGTVGVQGLSNGTFQGTVVSPTSFATCTHPVGQVMWTDIREGEDGSYRGWHQWYRGANCETVSHLGRTAWRVLSQLDGSKYLLVCFSKPGDFTVPTIAPDGRTENATYGCVQSNLIAPIPGSVGSTVDLSFGKLVSLPDDSKCRRKLSVVLRNPKYDPLKHVVIWVNGKVAARVKGFEGVKKHVVLKVPPAAGSYSVTVRAITVLDHRRTGHRRYRKCGRSRFKFGHRRHSQSRVHF